MALTYIECELTPSKGEPNEHRDFMFHFPTFGTQIWADEWERAKAISSHHPIDVQDKLGPSRARSAIRCFRFSFFRNPIYYIMLGWVTRWNTTVANKADSFRYRVAAAAATATICDAMYSLGPCEYLVPVSGPVYRLYIQYYDEKTRRAQCDNYLDIISRCFSSCTPHHNRRTHL